MKIVSPAAGIPAAIRSGQGAVGRRQADAIFRAIADQRPGELDRKRIAEALGLPSVDDVPDYFETTLDALWWMLQQFAFGGDRDAIRDFLERSNPKPRRMEVTGANGAPLRAAITAVPATASEREAAQSYYASLNDPSAGALGDGDA